ncbi:Hypothetical_protein [Hexamita inflata]|uniref:Hypothetical_protein n=1 Tax=Hexamita inflata TaxID=28002 RepID=A0AA86R8C8_9EUKA|nr:Hypothetical protein HINF_LOCUS60906 [Hexamita inflata]
MLQMLSQNVELQYQQEVTHFPELLSQNYPSKSHVAHILSYSILSQPSLQVIPHEPGSHIPLQVSLINEFVNFSRGTHPLPLRISSGGHQSAQNSPLIDKFWHLLHVSAQQKYPSPAGHDTKHSDEESMSESQFQRQNLPKVFVEQEDEQSWSSGSQSAHFMVDPFQKNTYTKSSSQQARWAALASLTVILPAESKSI